MVNDLRSLKIWETWLYFLIFSIVNKSNRRWLLLKILNSSLSFLQGYPGFPGGYPGAMQQQDPLFGYFSAVAGAVSTQMDKFKVKGLTLRAQ